MIVDDDPMVLESLVDYFPRFGIESDQLATFKNAATAILALRDLNRIFRKVLVDGLDGQFVRVAEAAIEAGIPPRAVILHTNGLRDYIDEAERLGISAYPKRVMPADIPGLIKTT